MWGSRWFSSWLVNNLIKSFRGEISINNFWVLEIPCILASPQNFKARTHLMLKKLTLPLSEECVLLLHTLPKHLVFASSLVTLLMSSHTAHQPLRNFNICCRWHFQHCICTTTPSHLLLLQLKSSQNTESTVVSMMHLSPRSLTATSICTVIEESALLMTLHGANCTALPGIWLLLVSATVTRSLTTSTVTNLSCYWILWAPVARYWSMRWTPQGSYPIVAL